MSLLDSRSGVSAADVQTIIDNYVPDSSLFLVDDYIRPLAASPDPFGNLGWTTAVASTGVAEITLTGRDFNTWRWGICHLSTGANASGTAYKNLGTNFVQLLGATVTLEWLVRLDFANTTGGPRMFFGFSETMFGLDECCGILFAPDIASNSNWQYAAAADSTLVLSDTGVLVTTATWYRLKMVIRQGAAVDIYVNGTKVVTGAGSGSSNTLAWTSWITKGIGGGSTYDIYEDYASLRATSISGVRT